VLFDSFLKNNNIKVAFLSVITSFMQLFGYGLGFLKSFIKINIQKEDEYGVIEKGFY
jgi:hypothetical protein